MRLSNSCAGLPALVLCLGAALATFPDTTRADPASGSGPLADQHAPAGVMFDHMHAAGGFMVGYRYAYTTADGGTLHGSQAVDDHVIMNKGCSPHTCSMKASEMTMKMHMLDIMYAPTNWMTLMVMPMWMSHDMTMVPLRGMGHGGGHGEEHEDGQEEGHGGQTMHAGPHSHGAEAFGDTIFGPELKLAEGPGYHLHISPMFSAPTGPVDTKMNRAFTHYGMQIGSGTWDFMPSITYTGRADRLTWGAQVLGIVRMEEENESGYRLGNVVQATGWASYRRLDLRLRAGPLHRAG